MRYFEHRLRRIVASIGIGLVATGCGTTPSSSVATETTIVSTASPAAQPSANAAADLEQARSALVSFFSALQGGRYTEASMLFGGSFADLTGFNPMVPVDDQAQLLQNACTVNGFQCLEIQNIVEANAVSPTEFAFVVEFQNEDGSLFTQPTQSQWKYTVEKVGDQFLVQELPVYLP
ncbi:MAG TPA: hypothetical protein VGD69_18185 [Herpetosiphonaceae bacterium]